MKPRRKSTSICPSRRSKVQLNSYTEVVAAYLAEDQHRGDDELKWFAKLPTYKLVLEKAAMCRTRFDKRHRHQSRIPESVLRDAHQILSAQNLASCKSFEALHHRIDTSAGRIKGFGELAVFDVACRIGAKLRLHPKKIYLHAGTRIGAAALGLGRGQKTIERDDLPEEFHCLSPRRAEDCLCIYKDDLKRIASRNGR